MTQVTERLADALSGRYRIERELGAGGMATVYLAEDMKHKRKVALKVLKPELAAVLGAERFVQEITTTASLQHPHILPLFDSGTADGFLYYVMPFIEGETLRDRLNRETQLGVDEAVRIAREVADALDYAHSKGVIHRDIKPENILLANGRPMVADFGIALAVSAAAGGRMTETGLSLGTPHYMSPEQATADKEISGRSDIYSLASVLYEMLAGQPPHLGGSAQQIIMKIIADAPRPVTELRKAVPPNVAAAVARALEKLPADRFTGARAFATALGDPSFATQATTRSAAAGRSSWHQKVAVPALAVAGVAILTALWLATRPAPETPVRRYPVEFLNPARAAGQWSSIAASPDGRRIAYLGVRDGVTRVYLRAMDQLTSTEVAGSDGASNQFFSPDGGQIAFMVQSGAIRAAAVGGGAAMTVVDTLVGGPGATWSPDGYVYYDHIVIGPLLRVRAQGGRFEEASMLDSTTGELQHVWPEALPNGRGVIMVVNHSGPGRQGGETDKIAVLDTETKRHKVLTNGIIARYAASGHLLYVTSDGALIAVPFDQDRMEITGEPIALADGIAVSAGTGSADLAVSNDGTLWYSTGRRGVIQERQLEWMTRDGRVNVVDPAFSESVRDLAISPDGKRAGLLILNREGRDIWVKELRPGGALDKLTFDGANASPFWSSDGAFVDLSQYPQTAGSDLRRVAANGSGVPTALLTDRRPFVRGSWSPRGAWLALETFNQDIYAIRPGVDSVAIALVATEAGETRPEISPDGKWLLYNSRRTRRPEVYVAPFPDASASLRQVSTDEGRIARWSRDGREILYMNGNSEMVAVAVESTSPLALGARRVLFRNPEILVWDVAPDGRFLIVRESGAGAAAATSQMMVVEGLFQELRSRGRK